MAAPTTLTQFWQNEIDAYTVLKVQLGSQLALRQDALISLRSGLGDAQGALARAQADLAIAQATRSAETDPGLFATDDAAVRKALALVDAGKGSVDRLLDDGWEVQLEVGALTASVAAVDGKLAEAKAQKEAADTRGIVRATWLAKAATPNFANLVANAATAKNPAANPILAAKNQLGTFLPNEYVALADRRFAVELESFKKVRETLLHFRANYQTRFAAGPAQDAIDAARAEYEATWAELGDFVQRGKDRYDQAVATLGAIAAGTLLTPGEKAELDTGGFSVAGKAAAASTAITDRDTALTSLADNRAAYEELYADKLETDPAADVSADAALNAARGAFTGAVTDLATKQSAYDRPATPGDPNTSPHAVLTAWTSALTDDAFRTVSSYYDARETFEELSLAADPATALKNAEAKLCDCLDQAARSTRAATFHKTLIAAQKQRADRVAAGRRDHVFSLIRGDI